MHREVGVDVSNDRDNMQQKDRSNSGKRNAPLSDIKQEEAVTTTTMAMTEGVPKETPLVDQEKSKNFLRGRSSETAENDRK